MGEAMSLIGSFGRHAQALTALAKEEAGEALALYLRLTIMLAGGLILATFGYIFLVLFIAFLIAMLFNVSWVWILLGLMLLHFLGAFICANHVRSHWRTPVFTVTAAELKKDFESLKRQP